MHDRFPWDLSNNNRNEKNKNKNKHMNKKKMDHSPPGIRKGYGGFEDALTAALCIHEEGDVLVHPEPLRRYNAGALHQATQYLEDIVGPVLGGQQQL